VYLKANGMRQAPMCWPAAATSAPTTAVCTSASERRSMQEQPRFTGLRAPNKPSNSLPSIASTPSPREKESPARCVRENHAGHNEPQRSARRPRNGRRERKNNRVGFRPPGDLERCLRIAFEMFQPQTNSDLKHAGEKNLGATTYGRGHNAALGKQPRR